MAASGGHWKGGSFVKGEGAVLMRTVKTWEGHLAETERKLNWRRQARKKVLENIGSGRNVAENRQILDQITDEIKGLNKLAKYQRGQVARAESAFEEWDWDN